MSTFYVKAASILGASGVLLAAYGAHGLEKAVNGDVGKLKAWNSASNIQLIHSVALFAIATRAGPSSTWARYAAPLILAGTVMFSGSIYALIATSQERGSPLRRVLGPTTPLGGLVLTAGWLTLAF
ncbi:hypothetical protein DFQ27_006163 [Actinomortierella ambigua]|uniref:DUF423 domain-containing protein n=1 Tax=Actinomortierella ambigua TaxID=1343610 RepID=A0A9P6QLR6_9FUNG|nr:hypothetical protein DFQ26_005378 [Actinomortierella ambigua]KAG0268660.1 hypothetical protein DFQ27_006163 [Actinomortierella ambigua]